MVFNLFVMDNCMSDDEKKNDQAKHKAKTGIGDENDLGSWVVFRVKATGRCGCSPCFGLFWRKQVCTRRVPEEFSLGVEVL